MVSDGAGVADATRATHASDVIDHCAWYLRLVQLSHGGFCTLNGGHFYRGAILLLQRASEALFLDQHVSDDSYG